MTTNKQDPAARPSEPSAPTLERQVCGMSVDDKGTECQKKPLHNGRCSVHPEPSAPQKSAIEIASERDLKVITEPIDWEAVENDAAPQTRAEPQNKCDFCRDGDKPTEDGFHTGIVNDYKCRNAAPQPVSGDAPGIKVKIYNPIAYLQELYADMGKRGECEICLKLQFCIEVLKEKLAVPAPSPTPSVSTPQVEPGFSIEQVVLDDRTGEVGGKIVHEQPEQAETASAPPYWMVTRFETLVRMVDRGTQDTSALEEYLELRNKLRELAAPSVAGTKPTPEERELLLAQFFPQGTPQVEERLKDFIKSYRELNGVSEKLATPKYDKYVEGASDFADFLDSHGVGAPAQPGPDIKKEKTMLHETSEDKLYPGSFRVEAIDHNGDGDCFVAVFDGPDAQQRATEYATWKNQPLSVPAQGTPEPPKVDMSQLIAQEILDDAFKPGGCCYRLNFTKMKAIIEKHWLRPYFPPASQTPEKITSDLCEIGRRVLDCLEEHRCPDGAIDEIEASMANLDRVIRKLRNSEPATPASTARTDGWVSVEDRLPEFGDTVLVVADGKTKVGYRREFFKQEDVKDWQWQVNPVYYGKERNRVTHWRELPAAPGSVPPLKDEDNYVAWCRYAHNAAGETNGIRLCDSDSPGAFKVYRHPGSVPQAPDPLKDDSRCAVCAWPLAESREKGCLRGNCSQRPLPFNVYDLERANREYIETFGIPFRLPAAPAGAAQPGDAPQKEKP